jgi:hypothetical protein
MLPFHAYIVKNTPDTTIPPTEGLKLLGLELRVVELHLHSLEMDVS